MVTSLWIRHRVVAVDVYWATADTARGEKSGSQGGGQGVEPGREY